MSELRITDTNSANDSKGRAFGLEGNDFIYVIIGLVGSLGLYLVMNFLLQIQLLIALILALPVLFTPLCWVLFLRHNKPAGYSEDWFDQRINGEGWSLTINTQPELPGRNSRA